MFNKSIALVLISFSWQQLQGMVRRFAPAVASAATMMAAGRGVHCSKVEEYRCFGEWDCPKRCIVSVDQVDHAKYPELSKLVEMYSCSEQALADTDSYVYKYRQIDRVINAERMKRVIEQEGLDRLYVPDKCICGGRDVFVWKKETDRMNRIIIQERPGILAKKINGNLTVGWSMLSLVEVQQLAKLAEKTGYYDWHPGNYIRDSQGRLALIDTEDRSFSDNGSRWEFVDYLRYSCLSDYMEPGAKKWLDARIKELSESSDQVVGLKGNIELDDRDGVDRELARREYRAYLGQLDEDYDNKYSAYRDYQDDLWRKRQDDGH